MVLQDLRYIGTNRFQKHNRWDEIVYEWEDVFCKNMELPLWNTPSVLKQRIYTKCPFVKFLLLPNKLTFVYQIAPCLWNRLLNNENIIICIIDYYLNNENTEKFLEYYNKVAVLCISNKEVYDYLKPKWKGKGKLVHLALSISDIYKVSVESKFRKEYDVVCLGRINPVLKDFLFKYKQKHANLTFVYNEGAKCNFHYYTSDGEDLGHMSTRMEYFDLMKKGRCGLYSTPGIDGGESYTNGFSQVTPRLLEYLVCGCHVIARYKNNSDTDYYQLDEMTLPAATYEEFETSLDYALSNSVDMNFYSNYLEKHYTSVRVQELKRILEG